MENRQWIHPEHGVGWKINETYKENFHLSLVVPFKSMSGTKHVSYTTREAAELEGWKEVSTLPKYNLYMCQYGCHNITVDVDSGVTPFMIKCMKKSSKDRPIAKKFLGEDGECIGTAKSLMYPTQDVPKDVVATHEWFKPNYLELQHFHSPAEREHVQSGGLLLRPRTDKQPIYHEVH